MNTNDSNGSEKNKKSYDNYNGNLPGNKGNFLTYQTLTDDEIDGILEYGKKVKTENALILKSSYGHNFVNVENLEKKSHNAEFIWSPFLAYDGIDPENEQYLKKQVVTSHYVEGNIHECIPSSTYYRGTTHWYNGFAFETKQEIRQSTSLKKLKDEKRYVTTITRKDGLIFVELWNGRKEIFFDTACPSLPEYDEDSHSYCFKMELKKKIKLNSNVPSEVAPVIEQMLEQYKMFGNEQAISVTEPIDRDQIMEQFERNVGFTKNFTHPNWQGYINLMQEYINQKREELLNAIKEQEREQEYQRRSEPLLKEIDELKRQNDRLQKMLNKALTFAQTVSDSRVGKLFFGKKAKDVLGNQDKDAKQLSEGR